MANYLSVRNVILAILAVVIVSVVLDASYNVNERERGVLLTNGQVVGVEDPGLHFKIPFIQSVVMMPVLDRKIRFPKLSAYSGDKQTADLIVSVSYHVLPSDMGKVYSKYSTLDGLDGLLIAPHVPTAVETVFGKYTAENIIQSRQQFGIDLEKEIRNRVQGSLAIIDSVQVENIDFDDSYEASIRLQMQKSVEIATQRNETLKQVEVNTALVNSAQAQADSQLAKATAAAKATRLQGEAEAYAIEVKAKALAQNQNLVELTKAEKWDGKLPSHMIPGSSVPFVNIK